MDEREREQFEAWVSASGRAHLLGRDEPHLWYKDLTVSAWWTAWQAATQATCPQCNGTGSDGGRFHMDDKGSSEYEPYRCDMCDGFGRVARAALAPAQPEGWQPIATAPKDGRMFLGWVAAVEYGESDEGRPFETDASDHDFCQWVKSGDYGYFENMMGTVGDASHITHWMPLPAAPSPTKEQTPASSVASKEEE